MYLQCVARMCTLYMYILWLNIAILLVLFSHDRVLEALTVNGEMCNISRFDPVLTALKMTKNPVLQLTCMQFINAIVNTPEDLDFRIHLRNEYARGGLGDVLNVSHCLS